MPKITKEFDKQKYDREYQREHYKKMAVVCTIEEGTRIEQAAKAAGMTKSAYMKEAILDRINKEQQKNRAE